MRRDNITGLVASFHLLAESSLNKLTYQDPPGFETEFLERVVAAVQTARLLTKLILHFGHVPCEVDLTSACMGQT